MAATVDLPNKSFQIILVKLYFRFINTMSSSSTAECLLCFTTILVKNFKRHCDARYESVNTKEKYKKQIKNLKKVSSLLFFK